MKKRCYYLLTFVVITIFPAQIIIDQPGQYGLGENTEFTPSIANDAIIRIDSSNVILDGRFNELTQSGGSSGLRGIEVSAGVENVQIQNFIIRDITGPGIYINDGCNNIVMSTIETLTISRGIEFNTSGQGTSNCFLQNLRIQHATGEGILVGSGCNDIGFEEVMISNVGSGTTFAIQLNGSTTDKVTDCSFTDVSIFGCPSGIKFLNADNNRCINCSFVSNLATATSYGFHIVGTTTDSRGNNLINCLAQDFFGTTNAAGYILENAQESILSNCSVKGGNRITPIIRGYFITSSSADIIVQNCTTLNIFGTTLAYSFHVLNGDRVLVSDCEAFSGTQEVGTTSSDGFRAENASCVIFDNCKSMNNTDDGFQMQTARDCIVRNCIASCNGDDGYTSDSSTNILFDNCISSSTRGKTDIGDGFTIIADTGTILRNCTSINNSGRGFIIGSGATGCTIEQCSATDSDVGFLLVDSSYCSITLCSATNCVTGFQNNSTPGTRAVFNQNSAFNNTGYGFIQTSGGDPEYVSNTAANNGNGTPTYNYFGIGTVIGQGAATATGANISA